MVQLIKPVGRATTFSLINITRFFIRHWYVFTLLIIILPAIISSIQIAVQTENPIHPFLDLGKRIFTADNALAEDVETLKENPSSLVGMEKPEVGIWAKFKYGWFYFWKVIFRLFSSVYLIFLPLFLIHKVIRMRNTSESVKNWFWSIGIFLIYLFIANVLFVSYGLIKGDISITLPSGETEFKQIWGLFLKFMPFNGLVELGKYIFSSFVT